MAMSAATCKAAMLADFKAKLKPKFTNLEDREDLADMDFDTLYAIISEVISETIINHITGNARCNGQDSNNDTHANVAIV